MDWGKIHSRAELPQAWKVSGFAENMVGGGGRGTGMARIGDDLLVGMHGINIKMKETMGNINI